MKFTADLHIHTDYDPKRDYWHGDHPDRIAAGIVKSGVDVYAITEHNRVSTRFFDVKEGIERLMEVEAGQRGVKREVLGLLGTEITVMFERYSYHIGYIFEGNCRLENMPEIPPVRSNIVDLEHWKIDHPGIAILNHPTLKDIGRRGSLDITKDFMASGLVDGVELLNGSVLHNGADIKITEEALRLYRDLFLTKHHARRRIAAMGCSDAHVGLGEVGRKNLVGSVVTSFSGTAPEDFFDAVTSANTKAVAVEESVKRKVAALIKTFSTGRSELGRWVVSY